MDQTQSDTALDIVNYSLKEIVDKLIEQNLLSDVLKINPSFKYRLEIIDNTTDRDGLESDNTSYSFTDNHLRVLDLISDIVTEYTDCPDLFTDFEMRYNDYEQSFEIIIVYAFHASYTYYNKYHSFRITGLETAAKEELNRKLTKKYAQFFSSEVVV